MTDTTLEILIGCIPPVLWNLVFFATKVGKEENETFARHSFDWNTHFTGNYDAHSPTIHTRYLCRVSACFNIIHCQDRNSVYPLQLYHSDIISQYGNSALMEHFNAWGNTVDPETFRILKNTIATVERESTAHGNMRHYQEGVFGIIT